MFRIRTLTALIGLIFAGLLLLAPTASAQESYPLGTTPPTVLGNDFEKSPDSGNEVLGAQVDNGASLPVTGGDVLGLTVIGLVAVGAGFGLVRYQRSAASRV